MKIKGFTLIEVLIVLGILVGLILLSVGSSTQLISKNEQQTLIDDIRTVIQYARIQAHALGHTVYLAPLSPDFDWSKGIVLSHYNYQLKQNEVLYQWQWHHPHWRLSWSGVTSSNKISLSNNTINSISNGTFTLSNLLTKVKKVIILNRLGRIKIDPGTTK